MANLTSTLLRPGALLMRRLRMPVKMSLMALMLIVPLLLMIVHTVDQARDSLSATRAELQGARLVQLATHAAVELQTLRGLTNRVMSGDTDATPQRDQARVGLKAALNAVDAALAATAAFRVDDAWTPVRQAVLALAEGRHPERRSDAFVAHTEQVEQLRQLTLLVGERSGLVLDPEAGSFFLMDLAVERVVPWSETLGLARGQGAALLARGDASHVERAAILGRTDALETQLTDLAFRMGALARAGVPEPSEWKSAEASSRAFIAQTRTIFGAEAIAGEAAPYFALGTKAVTQVMALDRQVIESLLDQLTAREQRLQRQLWLELGVSGLGLLLLAYLSTAFYSSFSGALKALHKGVSSVAAGDLSYRVVIKGRDELSDIGTVVEAMGEKLSAMVAEIRSSAVRVGLSGEQVASSGDALSQRTEAQAASLRQTISTVGELSEAVASNASAAQALDQLTSELRRGAEAGGAAMQQTVGSMSLLESSSRRVGEIIGVIDGIAFQTNILALNAAVEAARAGEAGRGFAVVASEVRQLAQRSAAAAGEIRHLIGQSGENVAQSVTRIQQVSQTLSTVVDGVRDVSEKLRSIAQASTQQSAGLEEVSQSVGSLDEITRQNKQMVAESSVASNELVTRAQALSQAVAAIRLRQGSADEARDLVHHAMEVIQQRGLDAAAALFRQSGSGFVDRDLYVFLVDREGYYRVHAAKPAMEGRRIHDVPGIDGDRFVRESWAAAQGSRWVEYDILNLDTGKVQPKATYVVQLNDTLLVGCGIYRPVTNPTNSFGARPSTAGAPSPSAPAARLAAAH